MTKFRTAAFTVLATLTAALTACGSDSGSSSDESSAGQTSEAGERGEEAGAGNAESGGAAGDGDEQAGANQGGAEQGGDAGASMGGGGQGGAPSTMGDIAVPASISGEAAGQSFITDASYFDGFAGSHFFARGGQATMLGGTATLITDCRLTVAAGGLKLEGGGQTITAPLISTNPNVKTLQVTFPDPGHIGSTQLLSFYDASGSAMNVGLFAGRVISVAGSKTGTAITCNADYASNELTDRLLDTLVLSASAVSAFTSKANGSASYTQMNVASSDLGGAMGMAVVGQGVLIRAGVRQLVTDCQVEVSSTGVITISSRAGSISESGAFTGAAGDVVQVVTAQGSPSQLDFRPAGNRVVLGFNGYGFVRHLIALSATGDKLTCPN